MGSGNETGWYNFVAANGGAMFDQTGKRPSTPPRPRKPPSGWWTPSSSISTRPPARAAAIAASNQKIAGMRQGRLSITTNGDWNFKPSPAP